MFEDSEFFPRDVIGSLPETFCLFDPMEFCGEFLNIIFGPSEKQRNNVRRRQIGCDEHICDFINSK